MRIGPLRPSCFNEERRWPPLELLKNRYKPQGTNSNFVMNPSFFNSHASLWDFNSFKPTYDPPFRLQVIFDFMHGFILKENSYFTNYYLKFNLARLTNWINLVFNLSFRVNQPNVIHAFENYIKHRCFHIEKHIFTHFWSYVLMCLKFIILRAH